MRRLSLMIVKCVYAFLYILLSYYLPLIPLSSVDISTLLNNNNKLNNNNTIIITKKLYYNTSYTKIITHN